MRHGLEPDSGRRRVERRSEPVGLTPQGDDFAAFSILVAEIYDAAVDTERWPGVLRKVRDFVGGSAAAIFSKDATVRSLNVFYDCGSLDPRYQRLYEETYARFDPSTTAHVLAEVEQPICTADIMPYDEFYQTRFYKEWGRPQGLVDVITAVLDRSATGAALCGVFLKEKDGVANNETRWRMRQVVPHIRRAVVIGRAIELKTAEAATFADTFDGLSAGMFLVDQAGRIVHANASGHAMLRDAVVLRAAGGKLTPVEPGSAAELSEVLAAARGGDAAIGLKGIALPLSGSDDACYVAHVLPLTSGARQRTAATYAAAAAVFVRKAEIGVPSPPEVIARRYNLTPSELRVLLAIVEIGGVPEAADTLGVSEATVKTHLHRLFGKTGATRQADLVKLVAGLCNPLVS
jgi:DNA-binding CsgD family transcriptional regulator/PAS domain-containing protein